MGTINTCEERQIWLEECEECDDCTSIGLKQIKKALQELSIAVSDEEKTKQALETLTESVIQLSQQLSFIDQRKQEKLISGENIKTINFQSLLGEGNIEVGGGGGGGVTDVLVNGMTVVSGGVANITDMATRTWVNNQNFATEDWVNDQGFVDENTNSLVNYYTKDETYTQSEVNDLITSHTVDIESISDDYINALS